LGTLRVINERKDTKGEVKNHWHLLGEEEESRRKGKKKEALKNNEAKNISQSCGGGGGVDQGQQIGKKKDSICRGGAHEKAFFTEVQEPTKCKPERK